MGDLFVFLVIGVVLWCLRWVIVAVVVIAVLVVVARQLLRVYTAHRADELARRTAIRQRAELQNAQVLRGDPRGFFGQYPLPDTELIPRWYRDR